MFKYLNEQNVPEQFRCVICLQICQIPIQCYQCLALHCYQCIIQNKNQCGRGCRQKIKQAIMKAKTVRCVEKIRCKCEICQEFISYKSYRKHANLCTLKNRNKNQVEKKRISKFKIRRIIFPYLNLFEQKCSEQKQTEEYFQSQFHYTFEKYFLQIYGKSMIDNQVFKCKIMQLELQYI